jgi:Ni,Fe-hydrogenase maturation factor
MLDNSFQFSSHCKHLQPHGIESSVGKLELGSIALIAMGNPLVEKDSKATTLLAEIQSNCCQRQVCTFLLDCGFSWLKPILKFHEKIVVIDTVSEGMNDLNGWVYTALTPEVLSRSDRAMPASHGLSWIDELKFEFSETPRLTEVSFLGISCTIAQENWIEMKGSFLEILHGLTIGAGSANA